MPLNIVIVGAGIAGLSAAFALNREGHNVTVFEQSRLLIEVGAAIHLAPNATRILTSWGCDLEALSPVKCKHLSIYRHDGTFLSTPAVTEKLQRECGVDADWLLVHRVDLHSALRRLAELTADGKQPTIRLACKIASIDADEGLVTLENGENVKADLIVGADGVHSRTIAGLTGSMPERKSTGQNCFRFLVPREKLALKPDVQVFMDKVGYEGLNAFTSHDRRLVVYPCREGKLLNVVAFHPSNQEDGITNDSSWLSSGRMQDLESTYETFCPELRGFCRLAEDLKLWSLGSRDPPKTFWRAKLVLIGDAAHPTLPHQGQGGAQALEDVCALASLLPRDTTVEQIPKRLGYFDQARYARAVTIMMMSKVNHERTAEMMNELKQYVPDAKFPENIWTYCWPSRPDSDARSLMASGSVISART